MAITASGARQLDDHNLNSYPDNVKPYVKANHDNYNNNNNRVRARAYARERAAIDEAYQDIFGRAMPLFVSREVEHMIATGIQPDMIRAVIEYTACAPRPSWAYARAVLYRNQQKGIVCEANFECSLADRGRDGCDDLPY